MNSEIDPTPSFFFTLVKSLERDRGSDNKERKSRHLSCLFAGAVLFLLASVKDKSTSAFCRRVTAGETLDVAVYSASFICTEH